MLSKTSLLLGSTLLMALPLGAMLPGCGGGASPFSRTQNFNSTLSIAPEQVALLSMRIKDGVARGTLRVSEKSAADNKTATRKMTSHKVAAGEEGTSEDGTSEKPTETPTGGEATDEKPTETPTGEEPTETPTGEEPTETPTIETPTIETATGGGAPAFSFAVPAGTFALSGTFSPSSSFNVSSFNVSGKFPGLGTFTIVGQIPANGGNGDYTLTSGGEAITGNFKTSNNTLTATN